MDQDQITEIRQYAYGINQLSLRLESAFKLITVEPIAENKLKFRKIMIQLGTLGGALAEALIDEIEAIPEDEKSGLK